MITKQDILDLERAYARLDSAAKRRQMPLRKGSKVVGLGALWGLNPQVPGRKALHRVAQGNVGVVRLLRAHRHTAGGTSACVGQVAVVEFQVLGLNHSVMCVVNPSALAPAPSR